MMRDLRGLRVAILFGAAAGVLGSFLFPFSPDEGFGAVDVVLFPLVLGSVLMAVSGLLWLRAATENQRRLGAPVEGSVWLRVLVAVLLPILGSLMLFQLAARIVDASGRAAGRAVRLGGWFAWWLAAYLASDLARILEIVEVQPTRLWTPASGVFLLLSMPGLHRFLTQVEQDQTGVPARGGPGAAADGSP